MYEDIKIAENIKKGHFVIPTTNVITESTINIIPRLICLFEIDFISYTPFKIDNHYFAT